MTYYTSEERARMAAAVAEHDRLAAAWTRRERIARSCYFIASTVALILFLYGVTR